MAAPEWAPPGVDVTKPSVARVYDSYLGGKDNFAVDREVVEIGAAAGEEPYVLAALRRVPDRGVIFHRHASQPLATANDRSSNRHESISCRGRAAHPGTMTNA